MSGSGPGERWTSRLYHCVGFHVSLVYCVLCIVSRVSCLVPLSCVTTTTPTYLYVHSVRGGGMHGGGGSHLCSVLCAL